MTTERPFGFWTAVAFVISGVIGAGIYVVPSQMAPLGWTGTAGWIIAGAAAVVIARVLSSVTEARPQEPGLVAMIGEIMGPLAGALVGWAAWVSFWCADAYIALTAARYAGQLVPPLAASSLVQALTACAIIAALTWMNLTSLRAAGRFQVVVTVLKLLPLAAVMLILLAMLPRGTEAFPAIPDLVPARDFAPATLFSAVAVIMVAIIGFESASIAAQRVRNPERNVPRATIAGTLIACIIYLVVCTGIDFAMPADVLAASQAPIAMFIASVWGDWAGKTVALFAVISAVGGLAVWTLMLGEVPLSLARAGLMPAWMGKTNRHDVAAGPLVAGSILTCALLLLGSWRQGAMVMDFMLRMTSVSSMWIYIFSALAALKIGMRRIGAIVTLAFCGIVMAGAGAEVTGLSVMLLATAVPLYILARKAAALPERATGHSTL